MTNTSPDITILMPAYNAEKYIGEAIASVLQQTFTNFELLIVNDGSTDDTEKIIRSFNDPRVTLINQANLGIAAALNNGLEQAKAAFIARFDADDICYPHRLEIQYNFMVTHPRYVIIGSDADYMDMNDEYVFTYRPTARTNEDIQQSGMNSCPFIHSSVLFKKEVIVKAGGYNIHAHTFEDHLLWLKVCREGKSCNLPETLLKVRLNPGSVTIDEKWRHKHFLDIKYRAIQKGDISEAEGRKLVYLLKKQENRKIKEGAYYALLGKKYLWDNYQPKKARNNLKKILSLKPLNLNTYCLFALSYMPVNVIQKIYSWLGPEK